ncbi:hypothetical protein M231_01551 [Tremella mesenterica]|uniref:Metallo-beta-lactamase domain-containing protein n=1 Tax=Tremella mesenterica TaxID=5217 RepID=A0A4Q1BT44_TREME|nr:hypothetical protein M231_01551 [Tremella mesenterica]
MSKEPKQPSNVSVHFLGTCAGAGPVVSRNCSSLAVDFGNEVWVFDAADGTLGRLHQSSLKMSNVTRIFITHMHADHVLGLVPILTTIMSGVGVTDDDLEELRQKGTSKKPTVNIYGPAGLRKLVRTTINLTSLILRGAYAVHELFTDTPSVGCSEEELHVNEAVGMDLSADENGVCENILLEGNGKQGKGWAVSAGPIDHRVPSLGYVLQEPVPRLPLDTSVLVPLLQAHADALAALDPPVRHPLSLLSHLTSLPTPKPYTLPSGEVLYPPEPSGIPARKLVIFGDCTGGTENARFLEICSDPSLLIHECTNAAIPELVQRGEKGRKVRTRALEHSLVKQQEIRQGERLGADYPPNTHSENEVCQTEKKEREERETKHREVTRMKAFKNGHSTPLEVGTFAKTIRARRVAVNHFSAMFPAPRYPSSDPYPSILSPMSPLPYPAPWPLRYSIDPPMSPVPLTAAELHLRLILQSVTDQIDEVWDGPAFPLSLSTYPSIDPYTQVLSPNSQRSSSGRKSIATRDFMILPVPSHELSESEMSTIALVEGEGREVMTEWRERGGVWMGQGTERRWVGVEKE